MNWYKQHKTAMPLPKVKNQYPPRDKDNLQGLTYVDEHLSEENANQLSEEGMGYLGAGNFGTVFQFDNSNVVKKLTGDPDEGETAKEIILRQKNNKPLPGLVYVYGIRDLSIDAYTYYKKKNLDKTVDPRRNQLFQIILEKVQPLSGQQKRLFTHYDMIKEILETSSNPDNEAMIQYIIKEITESENELSESDIEFMNILIKFVKTMQENNYIDADIYCENVGIRNNNEMVVLDLGSIIFE